MTRRYFVLSIKGNWFNGIRHLISVAATFSLRVREVPGSISAAAARKSRIPPAAKAAEVLPRGRGRRGGTERGERREERGERRERAAPPPERGSPAIVSKNQEGQKKKGMR